MNIHTKRRYCALAVAALLTQSTAYGATYNTGIYTGPNGGIWGTASTSIPTLATNGTVVNTVGTDTAGLFMGDFSTSGVSYNVAQFDLTSHATVGTAYGARVVAQGHDLTIDHSSMNVTSDQDSAWGVMTTGGGAIGTGVTTVTNSDITVTAAIDAYGLVYGDESATSINAPLTIADSNIQANGTVSGTGVEVHNTGTLSMDNSTAHGSTVGIKALGLGAATIVGSTISGDLGGLSLARSTVAGSATTSDVTLHSSSVLGGTGAYQADGTYSVLTSGTNSNVVADTGSTITGDYVIGASTNYSGHSVLNMSDAGTSLNGNVIVDNQNSSDTANSAGGGANSASVNVANGALWQGNASTINTTAGLAEQSTISVALSTGGTWNGDAQQNASGVATNMNVAITNGGVWQGNATMDSGSAGVTSVSLDGVGSTWNGNAITDATATGSTTIDLSNGAVWTGAVQDARVTPSDTALNPMAVGNTSSIALSSGATWVNTDNSTLSSLSLNNATLEMHNGDVYTQTMTGSSATIISDYNVNTGLYNMLTAGNANGDYHVIARDNGAEGVVSTGATLMDVRSGDVTVTGTSDIGTYQYQTVAVKNADGSTSVVLNDIPAGGDGGDGGNGGDGGKALSTQAKAAVNTRSASTALWYAGDEALDGRMNDARHGQDNGNGVWLNTFGGKQSLNQSRGGDYDAKIGGVMLGVDKVFDMKDNSKLLVGFAGSWGKADLDMDNAGGDINDYSAQVYAQWRLNNGFFAEGSVKAARFETSQDVISTDGSRSSGDYNSAGYGASLKGGYSWKPAKKVFVEPYVKLSAMRLQSANYTTDNGMKVETGSYDSLRVEGGLDAGICTGRNDSVCPYVHLAGVSELADGNSERINGENINNSIDGSGFVGGAGVRVQLTKNLSAHAALNYGHGEHSETPVQGNLGINWSF